MSTEYLGRVEPELLTVEEAAEMCGMGPTKLRELVKQGRFPKPVKLSSRWVRWRRADIQKWIAELPAAS